MNPCQVLKRWTQVPKFRTIEEECDFWAATELDPAVMHEALFTADSGESTTISLRMDPRMLARVKRLARERYLNYQSMIKQWLAERLEKELREQGGADGR